MKRSLRLICLSLLVFTAQPGWAAEEAASVSDSVYYAIPEPFTINFLTQSNNKIRYLQIKVALQSKDNAVTEAAEAILPIMQDSLRTLFSSQDYATVMSVDGRRTIQAQALETLQGLLSEEMGVEGLENVYFTRFIMQ